jgi:beta-N-acetylhexosaminidase
MTRYRNCARSPAWLLVTISLGGIITAALTLPSRTEPGAPIPVRSAVQRPPKVALVPSTCPAEVAAMPARRRLAQLLVVGVNAADATAAVSVVSSEQVGGIFAGGNATGLLRNGALAQVQKAARVPVSVAVDEEGGRVQRIDELDGSIPSARKMAQTMDAPQVRELGRRRGQAMRALGVTVDYAPDTDVSDQPDRSVIGDRSFSADPRVVRSFAVAFAAGLQDGGVQPVLKHFPGHGHASGDSHLGPVSTPPLATLRDRDLAPYAHIADFGKVGVMVGHLDVPDLTGGEPASLSAAAYQLLRQDYGFDGPIITDDLGAMRAISDRYDLPDAVVLALRSGADQALWSSGDRVGEVLDRLEHALSTGELNAARIDESVARVLAAKKACG